jgi:hypothetical protein
MGFLGKRWDLMTIDYRPNKDVDARLKYVREQHTIDALKKAVRRRPDWTGLENDEKLLADLADVLRMAYRIGEQSVPEMTIRQFSSLLHNIEESL